MGILKDVLYQRLAEERRDQDREENRIQSYLYNIEKEKSDLLNNPDRLERAVANIADYYSPTASTKKPKGESYGLATVEASKSSNDPTVGFGVKLRDDYTKALTDPSLRGLPAGQLLNGLAEGRMNETQPDGTSLREKTYRYKRAEDTSWWGGDKTKDIPGYTDWHKDRLLQEKADNEKESWMPSFKDSLESTGIGALIGGIAGGTGGGLAGAGLSAAALGTIGTITAGPIGGLLGAGIGALGGAAGGIVSGAGAGAMAGAVSGAVGELIGAPIKKLIHGTDWYQGQIQSNSAVDKAQAILTDVAAVAAPAMLSDVGIAKGIKATKAFTDSLQIPTDARETLTGAPFSRWYKGQPDSTMDLFGRTKEFSPIDLSGVGGSAGGTLSKAEPRRLLGYEPGVGVDEAFVEGNKLLNWTRGPYPESGPGPFPPDVPPSSLNNILKGSDEGGFTNIEKYSNTGYPGFIKSLFGREDGLPYESFNSSFTLPTGNRFPLVTVGKGVEPDANVMRNFEDAMRMATKTSELDIALGRDSIKLLPSGNYKAPAQIGDDVNDLANFENWQRVANGKLYSDITIPTPGKQWKESEIFDLWQRHANGKVYSDIANIETVDKNLPLITAQREKTISKVMENPTAKSIINTDVPSISNLDPKGTNKIVEKANELSDIGAKEAGLIPINEADKAAGIVPLKTGTVSGNIVKAAEREEAITIGRTKGKTEKRKAIVDTAVIGETERKTDASKFLAKQEKNVESVVNAKLDSPIVNIPVTEAKKTKARSAVKAITTEYDPFYEETVGMTRGDYISSMNAKAGNDPGRVEILGKKIADLDAKAFVGYKESTKQLDTAYNKILGMNRDDYMQEMFSTTDYSKLSKGDKAIMDNYDKEAATLILNSENRKKAKAEKAVKVITGMAAFGFGAGAIQNMISDFMPEDSGIGTKADAGPLSEAAKGIMSAAKESRYFAKAVGKTQTVMESSNFQNGLVTNAFELLPKLKSLIKDNIGKGAHYALMSPYQIIESVFKTGEGKAINPAPFAASFMAAGKTNIDNAGKIVKNILDEGGIKVAANQVRKEMEPIVELAAFSAKADVAKSEIRKANNYLKFLQEKKDPKDAIAHAADIAKAQENIVTLQNTYDELLPKQQEFLKAWDTTAQKLAREHASVRVSLALEDPSRELYPWLNLNRNEEVAVGKIRTLLDQYRGRLEERKLRVRDDYFPHSPNPDATAKYQEVMEDIIGGAPYSKFYSRTENSRPLLPDVHYSMNHYITDIEQRIQHHDMWKVSGWDKVRRSDAVRANPAANRAFTQLYEGMKPQDNNVMNTLARGYTEFEAFKRLFLNPSAGLKHLVKMSADIVSMGPKVFAESMPDVAGYVTRKVYNMTPNTVKNALSTIGIKSDRFSRQVVDDYIDSIIQSGHMRRYLNDMGMDSTDEILNGVTNTLKNTWGKVQDVGSFWINTAELLDRGISVMSGLRMAAKKGMTVDQAMYGTYDTILKNNFLYGQFNPSWLNDPKIRALLMFQATPFKIFERRLVNLQKGIGSVNYLQGEMKKLWKSPEGRAKIFSDIKDLRSLAREGESRLKANLVVDALRHETDFFGTPVAKQLMWDILTVGAATYGGAQAGLHLTDHFFHIPFLSTMSENGKMELAVSPITKATTEGYNAWKKREDSDDFLLGTIMSKWLGKYGPLPDTLKKVSALGDGDIPEIYQKGKGNSYLKFLFSIPGEGE